ncbi:MAG TPA: DUF547 domain-containing protein [Dongiaceae bacterium]|jgi:hypothetical protein|nr:DUF547 domain-containing protein [Dongiaceae bacterium]
MKTAWAGLLLFACTACASLTPPRQITAPVLDADRAWARVLDRYVNDRGQVDFQELAQQSGDLDTYVAYVWRTNPRDIADPDERLAYLINSYNALSMYTVLQSGIPKRLDGWGRIRFFALTTARVGDRSISLYDYENKEIRAVGDPRVHFALNCMAVSCPRLPRVPWTGAHLQSQLDHAARDFFSESRNLQVDDARRTVTVSAILDFFPEDFTAHAPNLIAYINRWRDRPIPEDYRVTFFDYDWTINAQEK